MKIALGCDPNAIEYTRRLEKTLIEKGYEVDCIGTDDIIYANTAIKVAECVAANKADRGILLCGTGIGMSIAANKVKGAYAALLADVYSAERSIASNNANIACFGAFTMGYALIERLALLWLELKYNPDCPSQPKVERYMEYDKTGH